MLVLVISTECFYFQKPVPPFSQPEEVGILKPLIAAEPSTVITNQCLTASGWQETKAMMAYYIVMWPLVLPVRASVRRAVMFKEFLWFDLKPP